MCKAARFEWSQQQEEALQSVQGLMQSVLMFGVKHQTDGSTMPKVPMGRKMQGEAYGSPNSRIITQALEVLKQDHATQNSILYTFYFLNFGCNGSSL